MPKTIIRKTPRPKAKLPEVAAESPESTTSWKPADLYGKPADYRRILFLEAVARAIVELEQCESREGFFKLAKELSDVREANWGSLPWRGAAAPEHFEEHVLARAFCGRPAVYPNRQSQPLAVVYDYTPGAKVRVYVEE